MTTFTGSIHRDNWQGLLRHRACAMLTDPGFREEDFKRLKDAAANALKEDLRSNNEEELAKERLQANIFAGTPYGHPVLGTVAGIEAHHPRRRAGDSSRADYTRAALTVGVAGDVPEEMIAALRKELAKLPAGPALAASAGDRGATSHRVRGRDHREGDPGDGHLARPADRRDSARIPTSPRSSLARAWLGEHRASVSPPLPANPRGPRDELRRLRLHRGLSARHVPVLPRSRTSRAGRRSSRSGSAPSFPSTRTWRCGSRSTSSRSSSATVSRRRTSSARATT